MTSELVDQAREWQQKNRDDLAAEVWRKLLRFNPSYPEALVQLAQIELRAAHLSEAEQLYRHASRLTPPPRGLGQLAAALQAAKEPPKESPIITTPTQEAAKEPPPVTKPAAIVTPVPIEKETPKPERTETRPPRRPLASPSTTAPTPPARPGIAPAPNDNANNSPPTQGIILKLSPSLKHTPKRASKFITLDF